MDVQILECSKIDNPKVEKKMRTFKKDFAQLLSESIRVEGLHQPIMVRPHPTIPGRFIVVFGAHRFYAVSHILKEPGIAARVAADMDDSDADMATNAENVWRNPLTKDQHLLGIARWHAHFLAKAPASSKAGAAGSKAAAAKRAKAKAVESGEAASEPNTEVEPATETESESTEGRAASFVAQVAAATGKSLSSAQRDVRIAKAFTPDQIEILEQMKASQSEMTRIAKIKDVATRAGIINLIASGMEVEDALKETLGANIPAPADGKSKEAREAKAAAQAETGGEVSDDEWFEEFCGQKAVLFKDQRKYKADAILFRSISEIRQSFRTKSKKFVAATKKAGFTGPLYNLVNRMCSISHPKDWLMCEECLGAGATGSEEKPAKCTKCYGSGYHLKTEVYI